VCTALVAGEQILGVMGTNDLRTGGTELPFAAAFYVEWEKWVREGLADALLFWAPWEHGLAAVQNLRKQVNVPVYLFRRYGGWQGKFLPPQSLEGLSVRDPSGAKWRLGWILPTPHGSGGARVGDPDWRDLFTKT
jgi:hypothetical protein